MAKDKKATEGEEAAESKKSKKAILIPVIVLVLGLGGGGYFFLGSKNKAEAVDPNTPTTIALGSIVSLDPITMNLSDGHVLKVGMALQLVKEPEGEHLKAAMAGGGGHGGGSKDASPLGGEEAKAIDEAIRTLGDSNFNELSKPGGRAHAKEILAEKIKEIYHGDVTDVYFTDFVMS